MAVLSLIKCHSQQKCRFCRQEMAESCHPVCVFDEAAKINLHFLQLKARGEEQRACEMEVNSSHLQPTLPPCVWNEPLYFEKAKSNQYLSENRIESCYRFILWSNYSYSMQHLDHIFCLLCHFTANAWSEAPDHRELPRVPGSESDLAAFLLTELQVSAELPLMASKRKGERLREGEDKEGGKNHKEKKLNI